MSKASVLVALALAAGLGAYLSYAWPRLPATVAWGAIYEGPRQEFAGILGGAGALILALSLAASWRRPNAAVLAPAAMGLAFGFVYFSLGGRRDPALACLGGALAAVALAFLVRRPKPKRVQPF